MSIQAINIGNGIYKFSGLSTDTKGTGSLVDANGVTIKYNIFSEFAEEDTGDKYEYRGSTAGWVDPYPHNAGERGADDAATSYLEVVESGTSVRANIDQTETVIAAYPCIVVSITGNDGNTGYVSLRNAAATGGASTPIALPNVADGATITPGMTFSTGLTAQGESVGCDVTFVVKAIKS